MRSFKSIGFNFIFPCFYLVVFYAMSGKLKDFTIIVENIYSVTFILVLVLIFSVNVVKANQQGISKGLYFLDFTFRRKTWREIKFYLEVDEIYSGQYGDSTVHALWFVDQNDKVCLRVKKKFRKNIDELLRVVDRFEDKHNQKLVIRNPYLMKNGWTKVDYSSSKINS